MENIVATSADLAIDLSIEDEDWETDPLVPVLETAVRGAVELAGSPLAASARIEGAELSLVLADDAFVRRLNHDWRGRDTATNVLSFPADMADRPAGSPLMLGDVVLARETTTREAVAQQKPVVHHAAHLVCHGTLHLLGYDHLTWREADTMERLETQVLGNLGIADPYVSGGAHAGNERS